MFKTLLFSLLSVCGLYKNSLTLCNKLLIPLPILCIYIVNLCIKWPQRFLSVSGFDLTTSQILTRNYILAFYFLFRIMKQIFQLVILLCSKPHPLYNNDRFIYSLNIYTHTQKMPVLGIHR